MQLLRELRSYKYKGEVNNAFTSGLFVQILAFFNHFFQNCRIILTLREIVWLYPTAAHPPPKATKAPP